LNDDLQAVRFNAQGLGYSPTDAATPLTDTTIADICTTSLKSDNHRLVTITAGSIIEVDTTTSTTCND
jgi:type IV fimbrial biogenesis protein FimT